MSAQDRIVEDAHLEAVTLDEARKQQRANEEWFQKIAAAASDQG